MNSWITKFLKPKIKSLFQKRSSENKENLWTTCECKNLIYKEDLQSNLNCCPKCGSHHKLTCNERFKIFFDNGEYELLDFPIPAEDPLGFSDIKKYTDRLNEAKRKTGQKDAVAIATGKINGMDVTVGAQDFRFIGGSFSTASAEGFLHGAQHAIDNKNPFIFFSCTGGVRVMENLLSLSGMTKSVIAVRELKKNRLPFISVLTNPTAGGCTASYSTLGDVLIAEKGAIIAFAGARVISNTLKSNDLPMDFQKSEWVQEHGGLDLVLERKYIKSSITTLLNVLLKKAETQVNTDATNVVAIDEGLQKSFKSVRS